MLLAALKSLFGNTIFLATISSLLTAQLLKMVIFMLSHRRRKMAEIIETAFWRTGGMPSSHSAVVCSLTTSIALIEGIDSNLFVCSFWFALVVLRDAVGVRRAAGLQAKAINFLGRRTSEEFGDDFHAVKEIQGHSPLEVIVGGLLGVFTAAGFVLL